ncbi:putative dioxygenase [Minicystis rosea]|nr:putative dioxygenase [Minicystis rosea]
MPTKAVRSGGARLHARWDGDEMTIDKKDVSRRAALEMLGAIGAVVAIGCGGNAESTGTGAAGGAGGSGTGGAGGASGTTGTSASSGTTTSASTTSSSTGGSSTGWATGDGAFLSGKDYGNPFESGIGNACKVFKSSTEGPCHSNTYHQQDVTEGYVGLPTRLEFLVVDADCNPVPDAIVEIWHCSPVGVYSAAKTAEASDIGYDANHYADLNENYCTGGDAEGKAASWFRGYQKAGSDGRVTFDTLFPGWYSSRTIHIHFRVTVGTTEYLTSQVFFDDSLNDEIIADHASYSTRGPKDTTNAADNVIGGGLTLSDVVMSYEKQSDGALLAWKAIAINA